MSILEAGVAPRDLFRLQRTKASIVSIAASAATLIAAENPDRIALEIIAVNNTNFGIAPFSITVTTNALVLPQNGSKLLTYDTHYKLCQVEWYATAAGMPGTGLILECILDWMPADYQPYQTGKRNAPVSARGSRAGWDYGLAAIGAKSLSRWLDNLRASDEPLHDLIRRRGSGP